MIDNKTKAIPGNRVSIEVEILQSVGNKKVGVSKRKEKKELQADIELKAC
jgi:hypothetical protein